MIQQIEEKFNRVRSARDSVRGKINDRRERIENLKSKQGNLEIDYEINGQVLDVLKAYATLKEQDLKKKIDNVVTKALHAIFPGENFKSKLQFGIKRGQAVVETKLVTEINDIELITDIEKAESGGVANVVGFVYQMLILSLRRPRMRQVIFADEPFKNLSREYLEPAARFIRALAEKLGLQIVLITHKRELTQMADAIYEFTKENNETRVNKIKQEK